MITWTFLLVVNFGNPSGTAISVPGFESLQACQREGTQIYKDIATKYTIVNVYKCIPSR